MRKKVDARIRTMIENCVKLKHRGMLVIVGDKGRDQVVNLHYMLSKAVVKARPTVLWCYKKDLYLSSHRKKRVRQIKKLAQRGLLDAEKEDPFALFVASTSIRYCYYHETHTILGNTFGMCVLQDFEALTPNLLARTIETVEGGGLIVMLLSNLNSLEQLYTMAMDTHARLRTESHQDVAGRFNERLVLSMASCAHCLLMDDELNILPTSSLVRYIEPVALNADGTPQDDPTAPSRTELRDLSESLVDTQPAGSLVSRCRTLDQARALVTFLDAASEKSLRSTVALTASRGRGKSASLGLAIAGALALGYSNIFVTAPSPDNTRTLFEFVFKGLDALGYKEHVDYDLVEAVTPSSLGSTNPGGRSIVRINVYREHRQTVAYIAPQHHAKLAQAELLVIDEAAAIPLPVVKSLLGPYLVFLCSTVNGYEGTGRSLSLKLIQQLREQGAKIQAAPAPGSASTSGGTAGGGGTGGRTFREVTLAEPIRYAPGDPIESWMNEVLCLDAANHLPKPPPRLPHPSDCDLFFVQRDTLFSFHKASERFLQACVSLLVASHYKNTPNDLLLLADAPAHQLFVLLGPVDQTANALPDVLAVVQVALEGAISRRSAVNSLAKGELPQGDLIPWTVSQQFQDSDFPQLSGARVVRLAVHPELQRAGYGTRALELLHRYYQGQIASLNEDMDDEDEDDEASAKARRASGAKASASGDKDTEGGESKLLSETLHPRKKLPPLLVALADRKPERLHYIGTSYGLTQQLYNFWRKGGYLPLYLRQSASETTGEHTCVMIKPLEHPEVQGTEWLKPFVSDFRSRFMSLLPGAFHTMAPALALSLLDPQLNWSEATTQAATQAGVSVSRGDGSPLDPYDLKRLHAYSSSLVDYHLILDLLPPLARAYMGGRLPTSLSYGQAAILVCLGLQGRELSEVEEVLSLPANQVLALFNKAIRKLHGLLRGSVEAQVARTLPQLPAAGARGGNTMQPHEVDLDEDLEQGAREERDKLREKYLKAEDLAQYAVAGGDDDFEAALGGAKVPSSGGLVQIKSTGDKEAGGKKSKHGGGDDRTASLYRKGDAGKKQKHGGGGGGGGSGFKPNKKQRS